MKVKLVIALIVSVLMPFTSAIALDGNVTDKSKVCMMQDSIMQTPGIPIEHAGKTYYGCCSMCSGKIKSDPEKYTKAIDPISGKKVDKALAYIYNLEGRAIYFESEANRNAFKNSQSASLGS